MPLDDEYAVVWPSESANEAVPDVPYSTVWPASTLPQ